MHPNAWPGHVLAVHFACCDSPQRLYNTGKPLSPGLQYFSCYDQVLFGIAGTISAHYPKGRDRSMLPGPCLEISVNARGGMSGGPAFDDEGRLVGILSSSFEHPDGLGPSYVSLLQPTLTDPIEVPFLRDVLTVNDLAARS